MVAVSNEKIKDFENFTDINKDISDIKISQAVKIDYFGNGHINVYYKYNKKPVTFNIIKNSSFFIHLENTVPDEARDVGISDEKIKDVKKLLTYVSNKARSYYKKLFSDTSIKQKQKKRKKLDC